MTPCIWWGTTHPCNPPHYGLWVNLHFFMICVYKHCFLPMLLVFAVKCCIKMLCSLPHNHYCCSLPSPVCLPYMPHLFTHCLPTIICVVLMSIVLFFNFSYFCDMLHFIVTSFWLVVSVSFSSHCVCLYHFTHLSHHLISDGVIQ